MNMSRIILMAVSLLQAFQVQRNTQKNEIHNLKCLQSDDLNQGRVEEKLFQVQYVAPFSGRHIGRSAARHVYVDLYNMSNS